MNTLINEISRGKNLELNLPKYATTLMSLYNRFANVRLCMNYFSYYEVITESESRNHQPIKNMMVVLNQIIGDVILPSKTGEELTEAVRKIDRIRATVIDTMNIFTSYTDIFNIYEYVLNRAEHRYDGRHLPLNYSDEQFTRQLMQFLLSDQDHTVMNLRISDAIRQLPIRMTKARFAQQIDQALSLYKQGSQGSVDDFLYMLRTSAMLGQPEGMDRYQELYSVYQELTRTDFKTMDEQTYHHLWEKLQFVTIFLQNIVDRYVMFMELVNDVYGILLSLPYAIREIEEAQVCHDVIRAVNGKFMDNSLDPLGEEVTDMLIRLEGKQEKLGEMYQASEYMLTEIMEEHGSLIESMMLGKQFASLERISILLSGSLFMTFQETPEAETPADEAYVQKAADGLKEELTQLFASHDRMINRAVMGAVLAGLPVFFENVDALQEYIYQALSSCSDEAEKLAVYEVLQEVMGEES